ncbi:MAG: adenosylmethionine--8-amino-7-oxononanoate transaminase [Chitinispirillaceae bacterium]|nr:adenosylmethionine--8-amino-7-oxononanoate transaminase [Chitinispirillaceae bacterium]
MQKNPDFSRLWMPFTSYRDMLNYPPLIIERGRGIYVYDQAGREYIDGVGSWWTSIFGHCHPHITAAVKKQLDKIEHVHMAGFVSEPALRLSHLLGGLLPKEFTRIFYSDDGSTAVEVALKIALQYHALRGGRANEFIGLGGGYHGDTLGAVSVSGIPDFHWIFHDRFKKQHLTDAPYCYRCPKDRTPDTCHAKCMDSLEEIITKRRGKIAACIFEPMVQGAAGMRSYPVKVLKRIFALCEEHKILTIADEVFTGFGRTGKLFACEYAGKVPDIICLAKGLTGGYLPMGATAVKEHVFEEFKGGPADGRILCHGHSFTGNPLAAAAACASMELIRELDIPASLDKSIIRLKKDLESFREYPIVGDVRSIGMIGAIEFIRDRKSKEPFPASDRFAFTIARKALDHGLLVRPLGDVLYFIPALIITKEQMDVMFSALHRSIKDILDARPAR